MHIKATKKLFPKHHYENKSGANFSSNTCTIHGGSIFFLPCLFFHYPFIWRKCSIFFRYITRITIKNSERMSMTITIVLVCQNKGGRMYIAKINNLIVKLIDINSSWCEPAQKHQQGPITCLGVWFVVLKISPKS